MESGSLGMPMNEGKKDFIINVVVAAIRFYWFK